MIIDAHHFVIIDAQAKDRHYCFTYICSKEYTPTNTQKPKRADVYLTE